MKETPKTDDVEPTLTNPLVLRRRTPETDQLLGELENENLSS